MALHLSDHSPVDGSLACFQYFPITKEALSTDNHVHIHFTHAQIFPQDTLLGVALLHGKICACFFFLMLSVNHEANSHITANQVKS